MIPAISTLTGGTYGPASSPTPASGASLQNPVGVTIDANGNVFFADNNAVWKVDRSTGTMSIYAGKQFQSGQGGDGGAATNATFRGPEGLKFDQAGNLYIVDSGNFTVRKVDTSGVITTVAGTPHVSGYTGDGGQATSAKLGDATYIAFDHSGNLYIVDNSNNVIRKVDGPTHVISTFAGNNSGTLGDGDVATNTSIGQPFGIAFDSKDNLYISQIGFHVIRMVTAGSGIVSTVAGDGAPGSGGDGLLATGASLHSPRNITVDSDDNLYIADTMNGLIRKVDPVTHIITRVAGSYSQGYSGDGGVPTDAQLEDPTDVAIDAMGNLYIADPAFQLGPPQPAIRVVSFQTSFPDTAVGSTSSPQNLLLNITGGLTITGFTVSLSQGGVAEYTIGALSGSGCSLNSPIADGTNCTLSVTFTPAYPGLRSVPLVANTDAGVMHFGLIGKGIGPLMGFGPGAVSRVAGNGTAGYSGDGGPATSASLDNPQVAALDVAGNLYFSDYGNNRIRKLAVDGTVTTVAGTDSYGIGCTGDSGPATSAHLGKPQYLKVDGAGNLVFADQNNNAVRKIAPDGTITTIAGTCGQGTGYGGNGDLAINAQFNRPEDVAVDGQGNLYIADSRNYVIRKVLANGTITAYAGNQAAGKGYSGDGGPATSAQIGMAYSIAMDGLGNLYIADYENSVIRMVTPAGIITTVAGTGTYGYSGDLGPAISAEISNPSAVTVDARGNLYISDSSNNVIRKVDQTGTITTVNLSSTAISGPWGVAVDVLGNLFISDEDNNKIWKLDVADAPTLTFSSTNVGATSAAQDVIVENLGNAVLNISQISTAANFDLNGSNTSCSASPTINPSASCVLGVESSPLSVGAITGTINITDSVGTKQISLIGTGAVVATSTNLSISPNPTMTGQSTTFTATVSPTPTGSSYGTVSFYNSSTLLGTGTVNSSGVATFTTSTLLAGYVNAKGVYSGVTGFTTSMSSTTTLPVYQAPAVTTTTISISPNPATGGQTITFTATMSPNPQSAGTVSFYNGSTLLGTASVGTGCVQNDAVRGIAKAKAVARPMSVSSGCGAAIFTTNSLAAGTYSVTAVYSGNNQYATSTSSAQSLTVSAATTATSTTLSISSNPVNVGQAVTFTAAVSPAPTGASTGTVSFYSGTTLLGTGTVSGTGVATFTTSTLTAGTKSITAVYSGNTGFATSTSSAQSLIVNAGNGSTTATLTISPNPATAGQAVTFTATVSPAPAGASTGTVSFYSGTTLLGTGTVNGSGVATFTTSSLSVGTLSVTAVYSGSTGYAASTSAAVSVTVNAAIGATTTILAASPTTGMLAMPLTLTATVSPAPSVIPGGTVSFYNGTTLMGTGTVSSSGVATFTTSSLALGTYSLTANYSGCSTLLPSNSSALAMIINPGYTVTAPPAPVSIQPAGSADIPVTVPPIGGAFNLPVTMSASGLPAGATATFNPPVVTPGANGAPVVMTIHLSNLTAGILSRHERFPLVPFGVAFGLCGVVLQLKRLSRKTAVRAVVVSGVVIATMMTMSCGGGFAGSSKVQPGSYVVTITGTSGLLHASTNVTIVIK